MDDYILFLESSKSNIDESEKKLEQKDYGRAIFEAQQGLEKIVKAYLLKEKIINHPKTVNHLAFHKILKMITETITEFTQIDTSYPILNQFYNGVANMFKEQHELFEKLNSSEQLQIIFWKSSLKIPLNENEIESSKNFLDKLGNGIPELRQDLFQILVYFAQNPPAETTQITLSPQEDKEIETIIPQLFGLTERSESPASLLLRYLTIMKPHFINSGMMSDSQFDMFLKFQKIIHVFTPIALTEMIHAFCHEQVSRYPTKIDGKLVEVWYDEKNMELKDLIERIKTACLNYQKIIE